MNNYKVKIATRHTPGIQDLEEMNCLPNTVRGGKLIDNMWNDTGNQLQEIEAASPEEAAKHFFAQMVYEFRLREDPHTDLTISELRVRWDESIRWVEVQEDTTDGIVIRVYRIQDIDLEFSLDLQTKTLISMEDEHQGYTQMDFKFDP